MIYLHGFASSPQSRKAQFFRQKLASAGVALQIPDLAQGDFFSLTITGQLDLIHSLAPPEPFFLMGSSLGGYLAALYAARHPQLVRGLVLLAPAFRLAERWAERTPPADLARWERDGRLAYFHYGEKRELDLGWTFLADARRYEPYPAFTAPALIFHGEADDVVPVEDSVDFSARHPNARLQVMASDHELGDCLDEMWHQMAPFLTR